MTDGHSGGRSLFIATLGTSDYESGYYVRLRGAGVSTETRYIQVARLEELLEEEFEDGLNDREFDVRVLTTALANEKNWAPNGALRDALAELEARFPGRLRFESVAIPDGKDSEEIFQLFEKVAELVEPRDRVFVDITHGFRAQPITVLLALDYVARVRQATIEELTYGAWQSRPGYRTKSTGRDASPAAQTEAPTAPVFDLTPMLALRDWAAALSQLRYSGDMRALAEAFKRGALVIKKREKRNAPKILRALGGALDTLGDHLEHNRLSAGHQGGKPIAEAATRVLAQLESSETATAAYVETKPFSLVADQIRRAIHPLSPLKSVRSEGEPITAQLEVVGFYFGHGQHIQGFSTLRETALDVVTAMAVRGGDKKPPSRHDTEDLGRYIQAVAQEPPKTPVVRSGWARSAGERVVVENQELAQRLGRLLNEVGACRNSLNHCGTSSPVPPKSTLEDNGSALLDRLRGCWANVRAFEPTTVIADRKDEVDVVPRAPSMLVLMNHELTPKQEELARSSRDVSEIKIAPNTLRQRWANVSPKGELSDDLIDDVLGWFQEFGQPGDLALVQGEAGVTFAVVRKLTNLELTPVYATTRRAVTEETLPDGSVRTTRIFETVGLRDYPI